MPVVFGGEQRAKRREQGAESERAFGDSSEDDRRNRLWPAEAGGGGVTEAVAINKRVTQASALQMEIPGVKGK